MLARLVKKGALEYDQVGNSYLYQAKYSRTERTSDATSSFIQRVFGGELNPFVAHFAENAPNADIARLQEEIKRIEEERKKGA